MSKYKLLPDWKMALDTTQKEGEVVKMHPYTLIRYTHKKWGIEKACEIAKSIINHKYKILFERSKNKQD